MDNKTKEKIALAVSYALNCHPCMEYHKKKAEEAGLTEQEMLESLKVAEMVIKGAASMTKQKTEELFGSVGDQPCCDAVKGCR